MMIHRMILATALAFAAGVCLAETIAVDNGIAVKESSVASPTAGMSMAQVEAKFGAPASKVAPVGKPPISRWDYSGFTVYFEYEHVIHSVISAS